MPNSTPVAPTWARWASIAAPNDRAAGLTTCPVEGARTDDDRPRPRRPRDRRATPPACRAAPNRPVRPSIRCRGSRFGGGGNVGRDRAPSRSRSPRSSDRAGLHPGRTIAIADIMTGCGLRRDRSPPAPYRDRHLRDLDAHLLLEACKHESTCRDGRPVQLAGVGARVSDQILHRLDVGGGRHHHGHDGVGDAGDGRKIARI